MVIKFMDGKKERVFHVNAFHSDGSPIDFDNPEHERRFVDAYVRAFEANGYMPEKVDRIAQ